MEIITIISTLNGFYEHSKLFRCERFRMLPGTGRIPRRGTFIFVVDVIFIIISFELTFLIHSPSEPRAVFCAYNLLSPPLQESWSKTPITSMPTTLFRLPQGFPPSLSRPLPSLLLPPLLMADTNTLNHYLYYSLWSSEQVKIRCISFMDAKIEAQRT